MNFYTNYHKHYCGIDLHSKKMYLCILDDAGKILFHKNMAANKEKFLAAVAPFRDDLVIAVECVYSWYWLADLCAEEGIEFVLGHALYMKAIHGAKAKNDKIDSEKIARMIRGGTFPTAYAYPREMRSTRDLIRRRLYLVRKRAEIMAHIQMTHHQYNLKEPGVKLARHNHRKAFVPALGDEVANRMLESDLYLCEHFSTEINRLDHYLKQKAKEDCKRATEIALLKTMPDIGDVLSITFAYEIDNPKRFPTVQHFSSYARLIKPQKTSVGKKTGGGGKKIGNAHLRWACAEASALMIRNDVRAKKLLERLMKKGSKARALGILNHKIGKAVYFMMLRQRGFMAEKFYAH